MVINWYGEGCFKIQTSDTVILSDPFDNKIGLTAPRFKADIILKTINSFPPFDATRDKPELSKSTENNYSVLGTGEYNFKEINIFGFSLIKESTDKFSKTVYLIEAEKIRLCFLGHIEDLPDPAIIEHLEDIDILFIPCGGKPFIEQKLAVKLIKQLQPKIAIPSFFKVPGLKRQSADIKSFMEEFNHKKVELQDKLTIKKKELSEMKSTGIVILKV